MSSETGKRCRDARKAAGLCVRCGLIPVGDGYKNCPNCRTNALVTSMDRYSRLKKDDLCRYCGCKPVADKKFCQDCLDKKAQIRSTIKNQVFEAYGGYKCTCGETEKCFLSIDHVDNNGAKERKKHGCSGDRLYRLLHTQGFPGGYQVLCMNCQWVKRSDLIIIKRVNEYRQRIKDEVYQLYGGYICRCCGMSDPSFLTIDHINNDGAIMRKTHKYSSITTWLKSHKFPTGYQILCMNCQHGKMRNKGICPHRMEGF